MTLPCRRSGAANAADRPVLADPDLFTLLLCVLILLPMSWLVYYSLARPQRRLHARQFPALIIDPIFVDPLITTVIIATSSSVALLRRRRAHGLAGGAHRHAAAPHRAGAGDRLVRHAAVSRRHRLGTAGGAEQRAASTRPFAR